MKYIAILSVAILFPFGKVFSQFFTHAEAAVGLSNIQNTNGVAAADYDRDGDLDLFFTGIKNFDHTAPDTWSRLMRNRGDGTFEDVTVAANLHIQFVNEGLKAERGEKMGASWGDYDNDGYPDLFLANSRENQLYHNNADGTFTDVTASAGVAGCNTCYSSCGLWWDHDRDGDLDLYVSNLNTANQMYENKGNGKFENITEALGIGGGPTITWASVAIDAGKDGFLDLLNVNDTQQKEFFENRSGVKYNETALAYRLNNIGADMGVTIGDPNHDGLFDIYLTSIFNYEPNSMFVDLGNRRYANRAKEWGIDDTGWGWGTSFLDFDHDTDEDLAAVNGPIDEVHHAIQPDIENFFFKNKLVETGQPGFEDISKASGTNGLAKSKGLEVADFDGDGDLDMVVANMIEAAYFFKNETIRDGAAVATDKNWLQIMPEGTTSNRDGFGTTVKIRLGEQWYYRYHHGGMIFGQSVKPVHFGLGSATVVDEIRFTWLTGKTEAIYDIPINQIVTFKEGTGKAVSENTGGNPTNGAIVEKHKAQPNPFFEKTTLEFELGRSGLLELEVFSAVGQRVFSGSQQLAVAGRVSFELDGDGLGAGVYFYRAQFGEKRMVGKVIKH